MKFNAGEEGSRTMHALARRLALAAALLAVASCNATAAAPQLPAARAPALLEVTDETGRRIKVPQPVQRIVSLAPSLTETLYALGAQDRLVGVTDYCDYPPEAKSKPKVGGAINPNLEEVVALRPDLVLATKSLNRRETVEALERLAIPTYATDPRTVEGVLASTLRVAELIGAREQGEALVASLRARLADVKRRLRMRALRRVLFVVWTDPLISVGRDTFIADTLRWAGAESVADTAQDWPRLGFEEAVRLQPEYLVFADSHSDEGARNLLRELRERPGWRGLEAVRQGRVAVVSDAINRPAPRLVDAIEQLARQLHPDAFERAPEMRNSKSEARPPTRSPNAERKEWSPCGR